MPGRHQHENRTGIVFYYMPGFFNRLYHAGFIVYHHDVDKDGILPQFLPARLY